MQEIFDQQNKFQGLISNPTHFVTEHEKIKSCNIQIRRAIDELHEALREMPFDLSGYGKSKKVFSFNPHTVVSEIVDAQLFMINTLNFLGITYEEFQKLCLAKQRMNVERFQSKKRFIENKENFFIIIEGVDGVGKSKICEEISHRTGYPIIRMPETAANKDIESYSQFYRKVVASLDTTYILDRFYPSSMVYSTFFNRSPLLDDLNDFLKKKNVFTFIIDAEEPYRSDDFINEEQWPKIRQLYLQQAKTNKWKVIQNNSTLENCVNEILGQLRF